MRRGFYKNRTSEHKCARGNLLELILFPEIMVTVMAVLRVMEVIGLMMGVLNVTMAVRRLVWPWW